MKNEDIYNGITHIRDHLIDGASGKLRKPRPRFWIPAVAAAVLALAVGAAFLWQGGDTAEEPAPPSQSQPGPAVSDRVTPTPSQEPTPSPPTGWTYPPTSDLPFAVALAAYPEQPNFPASGSESDLMPWVGAHEARRKFASDYDGGYDFFATATAQFLSGSDGENRVVSPLNIYMALATAAGTAGGNSRAQLLKVLGVKDLGELRRQVTALWNGVYQDDGKSVTLLANSIWLNQDMDYIQETADVLAQNYYASSFQGEMGSKEYNQALQDWINRQTGGLLEEQAAGVELAPDTAMALISTIYYRGTWESKFFPENTAPGTFHASAGDVTCDFMHSRDLGVFYQGDGFSAINWHFEDNDCRMWFLLPDEGIDVEELLQGSRLLTFLNDLQSGEGLSAYDIHLTVPKFDVSSDLDLRDGLAALMVTDVFDPDAADFSPLLTDAERVYISQVKHAARLSIDEEGCTAAAFTALPYGMGGPEPEEIYFDLDRPFLFVLTSGPTDLPLFAGIVNDPS